MFSFRLLLRKSGWLASIVLALGVALPSWALQVPTPGGSPRIGFAPIGTPFGSSAAYSYLAGRPVLRLPNGITIDPYNTGAGMTLSDPSQEQAALQQRYQIQNAEAAQAYQQAREMQQKAVEQANATRKTRSTIREGFDPKSGRPRTPGVSGKGSRNSTPLFDSAGNVVWPDFAPSNPNRAEADAAIKHVKDEVAQKGVASVATTLEAKRALRAYGTPALKSVPGGSKILAERLREHLIRLDGELDASVESPSETR